MIFAAKFPRRWAGSRRCGGYRRPAILAAVAALPFLWLALLAGAAWAQQPDQDRDGIYTGSTGRPVAQPESLKNPVGLRRGIQFGAGPHNFTVKSEPLQTEFAKSSSFSDGGSLHVDWLLDSFRATYLRQLYRPEVEGGLSHEGQPLRRVAYDSDQLWLFHGGRPWYALYLGYGLGFQRREIVLTTEAGGKIEFSETLAMAGLMLDYAFAPPISLQIRLVAEEDGGFFQASGNILFLSYMVPL